MRGSNGSSRNATALCLLGKRSLLGLALGLMLVVIDPQVTRAQVPEQCEDALNRARDLFEKEADFEAARNLIEECNREDVFSDEEKREVFKLLARIYEAMGLAEEVMVALAALFELVPNFMTGPEDPPSLIRLIDAYKRSEAARVRKDSLDAVRPVVEVTLASEQGQGINNAQLQPVGDRWVVTYDLDETAKKYRVTLLLSTDGGGIFSALPQAVSGDEGDGIRPGNGKRIVWTALADFPQGLPGDQYRLKVETEKQRTGVSPILVGGAVAVVAGVAAALLIGGEEPIIIVPPMGIPMPPVRPGGN